MKKMIQLSILKTEKDKNSNQVHLICLSGRLLHMQQINCTILLIITNAECYDMITKHFKENDKCLEILQFYNSQEVSIN